MTQETNNEGGTSILFRFRRTTYEQTFVKVPVIDEMINEDGRLNFDALVAAGVALAKNAKWAPDEESVIEPHPIQMPLPEGWKS